MLTIQYKGYIFKSFNFYLFYNVITIKRSSQFSFKILNYIAKSYYISKVS